MQTLKYAPAHAAFLPPQEAPICDTAAGRCANRAGTFSTAWSVKLPAMRQETVFDRLFKRGGSGKSRSQPQYVQA